MTDSAIARGITPTRFYDTATFYRGIESVYNATANATYRSFLTSQIDAILTANGSFRSWDYNDHQLDSIRIGSVMLYLYTSTTDDNPQQKQRYKNAADFLYDQLVNKQKKTPSGGYWHKDPRYPNQMWLDGLYMAEPFAAAYTSLFTASSEKANEERDTILLQFDLVEQHCRNQTSGLLKHGYDESKRAVWADPVTGASPLVWIRAQGWYAMALVDTMEWFPLAGHHGHDKLRGYLLQLAQALKRTQDPESGGWWLVMDEGYPGRKGNYIESSGTAMYTYALLKGVRMGYLDKKEYLPVGKKAYEGMVERFVKKTGGPNGTLNWEGTVRVGSLDSKGDFAVSFSFCSFLLIVPDSSLLKPDCFS